MKLEVVNLTHVVRARIRPGADAIEISGVLRDIIFDRLHLFWRVQRGDYPKGRRIPVPMLRARIDEPHRSSEPSIPPADVVVALGSSADVLAAIDALYRTAPSASELDAIRRMWADYRFSRVVRSCRKQAAALTERMRTLQIDDP